jgi:AcrR family transcriptional regulator
MPWSRRPVGAAAFRCEARPAVSTGPAKTGTVGRPRSDAARCAILEATYALLLEQGFARLSIEGIAARAGTGKATIYRWWSGKGDLAIEAFLDAMSPRIAFPDTGSALADLRVQLRSVAREYRGPTGHIIKELIALGQSEPDTIRQFVAGYLRPRRQQAGVVIRRAMAEGELRAGLDVELVIDLLYAPIYHRMLVTLAPIDDGFVDALLDMALAGLAP